MFGDISSLEKRRLGGDLTEGSYYAWCRKHAQGVQKHHSNPPCNISHHSHTDFLPTFRTRVPTQQDNVPKDVALFGARSIRPVRMSHSCLSSGEAHGQFLDTGMQSPHPKGRLLPEEPSWSNQKCCSITPKNTE